MNKIIVDFEMNCSKEKEIIEIGAVMLNSKNEIISEYSSYVAPTNCSITKQTTKLTGITSSHVAHSSTLQEILTNFLDWCGSYNYEIYSWSMTDYTQLYNEALSKNITDPKLNYMLSNWHDYQREFSNLINYDGQLSLKNAISAIDSTFKGKQHSALADAQNTASLFLVAHNDTQMHKLEIIKEWFTPKSISNTIGDLFPNLALLTS